MSRDRERYGTACPVCEASAFTLLTRVWRNYHLPKEFTLDPLRWFAECDSCSTVVMLPLHDDFESGGTVYYDQREIEAHVQRHFEQFQRPNYDRIREFLQRAAPAAQYRRWLDVGSVGYPTTFTDYEFTTIEPDARAAQAGADLFKTGRIHAATVEQWHDAQAYDGLLFNNSFYCLTNPAAALLASARLLRSGGRLVITNSSNFAGAICDRADGRVLAIEDLIFGETLQVYYNRHSLTYLLERHGFRLVEVATVAAYGRKTMTTHVFEWDGESRTLPELLPKSRAAMDRTWREVFAGFESSLDETAALINRPETVLAGSLDVITDLITNRDLSRVRGILPIPDAHLTGATVNGQRVLSLADVSALDTENYEVVVCSFQDPDAVVDALRRGLGDGVRIFVPTRRSGMDSLHLTFRGARCLSKGWSLRALPYARRVNPVGRRVVVYGAGAGGRDAIARLEAAGVTPVAVCDSDAARAGTMIGVHKVTPFGRLSRADYDLVVIASRPGFAAVSERLVEGGLQAGRDFIGLDELSAAPAAMAL